MRTTLRAPGSALNVCGTPAAAAYRENNAEDFTEMYDTHFEGLLRFLTRHIGRIAGRSRD